MQVLTANKILKNNGFVKTNPDKNNHTFNDLLYTHFQYLENFNALWYAKIEGNTRKCKFYSIYTKFVVCDENFKESMLNQINEKIACNVYSGKCNRYLNDLQQVDNFIKDVQIIDRDFIYY